MRSRLRRLTPDIFIAVLLLAVPLLLFAPQTLGARTLVPADNLFQWEPYRSLRNEVGVERPHNTLISDLVLQNAPWKQFAREQIQARRFPLWQPYILGGSPFLAAGQSSAFYPLSALFLLMPVPAAFGWFTVLQLWLAGLNMFVLLRVLGVRRTGALVAGLAYQLSGFFLASAVFPMVLATAAWLPLALAMVELVIRQQPAFGSRPATLPWATIGAITLGVAALAGHPEAFYFMLLVMGFYAAWRLLAGFSAAVRDPARGPRLAFGALLRRSVWLLAMVAAGLALGAVQLVPAYELANRSFRHGAASLAEVRGWAYPLRHLVTFFVPNFFGSPAHHAIFDVFTWQRVPVTANSFGQPINHTAWGIKNYVEGAAYMGLLPMALALVAVGDWISGLIVGRGGSRNTPTPAPASVGGEGPGRPYRLIFAVLGLLSASFAFGAPTYALLYYGLPFISQSHAPFRWVWPLTLCVAVLAGFGVEAIQSARERTLVAGARRAVPLRRWVSLLGGLCLGIAGAAAAGVIVTRLLYAPLAPLVERIFERLALAPAAFPDARAFFSYQAGNALLFAAMLALAGLALRLSASNHRLPGRLGGTPLWLALAPLAVALDLGAATFGFNPAADPALLDVSPPSLDWLKQHRDDSNPWRLAVYEQPGTDTLNANIAWLHKLEDISGYDSLIPAQYASYMEVVQPQVDLPYNRIAPIYSDYPDALDSPLLDLLGVRYVVSEVAIDNPRYSLTYQDEAVFIYQNREVMPRAFTLPAQATALYSVDGGADGLPTFAEATALYDVRLWVLVAQGARHPTAPETPSGPARPGLPLPAAITVYRPGEVWVDVDVSEPSWLVVADSHFPGWRAWVRPLGAGDEAEQETDIWLVSGNFRGVRLEPGVWTVRMKYSPDSFRFGAFASFLTGLGLVFALGVWAWRFIYREAPEGSDDPRTGIQRVAKNTLTPIVLNLFNKGISFILTFAMLRVLGPAGAGEFRYAVVIYGWFEILANFGLNTFLTREVARHRDGANIVLSNTTLLRLALAVLGIPVLAGFLMGRQALVSPPLSSAALWTIGLLYGGLFFSTISTGLTALFYAYEKAEYPAAIQTVSAFLTTSLGIGSLLLGWGIVGLAAVSITVNFITLAFLGTLAVRTFFRPRLVFDWRLQKSALGESFPLMLNHLLATLFFRIDVVLLEALKGNVIVGWYGVVYTWVDAIMVIPSYFTLSLFPVMSRQAVEDRPALRRTYMLAVKLLSMIAVPMAIMTTLLAPFLVGVLGGRQFLPHGAIALQIFIWSILIGWINGVTQYVIIALNRQRALTVAFLAGAAFNIVANLIFIPRYSYPAAAVVTILSELVLWGLFYTVILSELGKVNWLKVLWRIALAGAVSGAATWLLAGVSMALAFAVGSAIYGVGLLALRPLSEDELRRLAPALPAALRARLLPRFASPAGE